MHADEARHRGSDLQKLVSAARAVIANDVALPQGCVRIERILYWLGPEFAEHYPVFGQFTRSATLQGLPMGSDRLHWDPTSLAEKDAVLTSLVAQHSADVLAACWQIIEQFGAKEP